MDRSALYETDFHAWALHQAQVLRGLAGSGLALPNGLDLEHVAEGRGTAATRTSATSPNICSNRSKGSKPASPKPPPGMPPALGSLPKRS